MMRWEGEVINRVCAGCSVGSCVNKMKCGIVKWVKIITEMFWPQ